MNRDSAQPPVPLAAPAPGSRQGGSAAFRARWQAGRAWAPWLAGGLLLAFALNFIWWSMLSPAARKNDVEEFDIPAGTQAAIDRGEAVFLPNKFSLAAGGWLRIVNKDTTEHTIGNVTVPPGAVAELSAPANATDTQITCTIHPAGYLDIQLTERPPLASTLLPTLLLGAPVGGLAGLVAWVTRKIG